MKLLFKLLSQLLIRHFLGGNTILLQSFGLLVKLFLRLSTSQTSSSFAN